LGIGNDETYLTIKLIYTAKTIGFIMLTTSAALDPEHARNLSIHFCLPLALFAKLKRFIDLQNLLAQFLKNYNVKHEILIVTQHEQDQY